jgi:hypothetical protein
LWVALATVGMTIDFEIFKTVLDFTLAATGNHQQKMKVLSYLAKMKNRPCLLLEFFLEKLLLNFIEIANIHTDSDVVSANMFELSQLIELVLEHEDLYTVLLSYNNLELKLLLRKMWFLLTIFLLQPNGQFPAQWKECLRRIAVKCPLFTIDPKERSLVFSLESDPVLMTVYPETVTYRIYTILGHYFPALAAEIRQISWPIALYLTAIYQVELLRMKSLSIEFVCGYLVDDRLQNHTVYAVIESIADSVLRNIIRDSNYKKLQNHIIECHLKTLLLYSSNRNQQVRKFLIVWIKKLMNVVPKMLFNRNAFNYMLDILLFLDVDLGYKKDFNHFESRLEYANITEKMEVGFDFLSLCEDWLKSALKISSLEALPILESYLMELNGSFPWLSTGQMTNGSKQSLMLRLCESVYTMKDFSAPMIRYSTTRANFLGEVKGMIASISFEHPEMTRQDIVFQLSKRCSKELKAAYKNIDSPSFLSELHICLCRAAALIILAEEVLLV